MTEAFDRRHCAWPLEPAWLSRLSWQRPALLGELGEPISLLLLLLLSSQLIVPST